MNARYVRQYDVASLSKPAQKPYKVSERADGGWECSCPAWTRHMPRTDCKHIDLIRRGAEFAAPRQAGAAVRAGNYEVRPRPLSNLDLADDAPAVKPRRGGSLF